MKPGSCCLPPSAPIFPKYIRQGESLNFRVCEVCETHLGKLHSTGSSTRSSHPMVFSCFGLFLSPSTLLWLMRHPTPSGLCLVLDSPPCLLSIPKHNHSIQDASLFSHRLDKSLPPVFPVCFTQTSFTVLKVIALGALLSCWLLH